MKIGITAGDPAGIGLEVVLKAVPAVLSEAEWVLFVDSTDFEAHLERFAPFTALVDRRWFGSRRKWSTLGFPNRERRPARMGAGYG